MTANPDKVDAANKLANALDGLNLNTGIVSGLIRYGSPATE